MEKYITLNVGTCSTGTLVAWSDLVLPGLVLKVDWVDPSV